MKGKTLIKTIGLGIITLAFSAVFWYAVKQIGSLKFSFEPQTLWGIGLALLFYCFFLALVAIFCLLVKSIAWRLSFLFIFNLPYVFFFPFDIYAAIIILLLTLAFWYYFFKVRGELRDRIKFSPLKVTHFGLRTVMMILLVA